MALKTNRPLIIDDDEIVHQTLRKLLKSEGYDIDSAYGEEEALRRLDASYNLLICDIRLPDLNGIEVLMLTGCASLETTGGELRGVGLSYENRGELSRIQEHGP